MKTYVRASDGLPVTEDEALHANGILRDGYWVHLSALTRDSAPNGWSHIFVHDGQEKVTLTDSDIAYYEMVAHDQNAWRNPSGEITTQRADSTQSAVLGDSAAAWKAMVEHDQNAWKNTVKVGTR